MNFKLMMHRPHIPLYYLALAYQ